MTTAQIIGKRLKEIRLKKHLSQEDVAKGAGISTNYYAIIERAGDEKKVSLEVFEGIIKSLKVKSSDILPF